MADRQAVLLIHGVGEQKPMDTLRGFVDAVWRHDTAIHHPFIRQSGAPPFWSKPDYVSDSFELRRLTTPQNISGIRTDFFEFYWQHLMQGTTVGHVVAWSRTLLLRSPRTVPRQLQLVYWVLVVGLVIAAAFAIHAAIAAGSDNDSFLPPWLSLVISVAILPAVGFVVRSIVGDAARYLHVAPPNVQRRHEIRQAGLSLLNELHARGYNRIIVVGHSLGSVIGYDILTHAWPTYNQFDPTSSTPQSTALEALESLAQAPGQTAVADVQATQRAYFDELVQNGNRWRVSDFITLGSPLAHASILLATDTDDLRGKQNDREFPTCLPVLERLRRAGQLVSRFSFELPSASNPSFRVPHHAAPFAPTRWTNLYFPNRLIVRGDLIGGPLAPMFGAGVRDVPVQTSLRGGFLLHTLYWRMATVGNVGTHIEALRHALDLPDVRK